MILFTEQDVQACIEYLKNLIRFNTTNPPGNELVACEFLAKIFEAEGIAYQLLSVAPGRANIVARLKGDGTHGPLLLASHLDVVPCEADQWSVDPFEGVIKNDMIWGRGAVDMKHMTAMSLAVFLKAHRDKLPLKRDLVFAAVADEETGCRLGSQWLVKNHPDLVRAEYVLNELGGFSTTIGGKLFYPIGVAEKGRCWIKLTCRGDTGHASIPHDNQALARVSEILVDLQSQRLPFHPCAVSEAFVQALAKAFGGVKGLVLKAAAKKAVSALVLRHLFPNRKLANQFFCLFHNLITPTILHAGQKENVIPSVAEVTLDGRILPGQTPADLLREVRTIVGARGVVEVLSQSDPLETPFDTDFFALLCRSIKVHAPEAIPVPFLNPGATDNPHYARLGAKCYGFTPAKFPPDLDFTKLFHGHDERIPLAAVAFGAKVLWTVILESCVGKG